MAEKLVFVSGSVDQDLVWWLILHNGSFGFHLLDCVSKKIRVLTTFLHTCANVKQFWSNSIFDQIKQLLNLGREYKTVLFTKNIFHQTNKKKNKIQQYKKNRPVKIHARLEQMQKWKTWNTLLWVYRKNIFRFYNSHTLPISQAFALRQIRKNTDLI